MKKFYLLWLVDEIRPKVYKDFYLTSLGPTSKEESNSNKFRVFLTRNEINNRVAFYDSSFSCYVTKSSKIGKYNILTNYNFSKSGYSISLSSGNNEIEFVVNNNELYLLSYNNYPYDLIYTLVKKYKLKNVYSKEKLFLFSEIFLFYFVKEKINSDHFLISEGQRNGLFGDKMSDVNFRFGEFKYNKNPSIIYPLFFYCRNEKYHNYLTKVDYYKFIKDIKQIEEFDYQESLYELSFVSNFSGEFYELIIDKKLIGFVCFSKISETFIYVSYLAIIDKYRKCGYSKLLVESIKELARLKNKNLILSIEVSKLYMFYIKNGFSNLGAFYFE